MDKPSIQAAFRGTADCRHCAIRDMVLFADPEEPDFELIHRRIDDLHFARGTVLYHQGESGRAAFTLRHGLVKLVQYTTDGTQRIVRLLRTGDVSGLQTLLDQPYQHAAMALTAIQVCRLPVEVLHQLNQRTPRLHRELMAR